MFKNLLKLKTYKPNLLFLLGLILSIVLLWPLAKSGYFSHHDDVQVIRLYEMDKCIKDFQLPCRWVPDLGGGYGYPLFNFYAPAPYYIGEIFYFLTGNFLISAKLMFAVSFILSYVFMYLLGSKLWGRLGGTLSAIFYIYVPYHAVNMYVRGAMGELFAMALFPLILYSVILLSEKVNLKNMIFTALSMALLITSHNLSAMLFLPITVVFVFTHYFKDRQKKILKFSIFSVLISILLTSSYWVPASLEGKYVHIDSMTVGYFSYTEHFKGLTKLFLDRSWSWGPSIREFPGSEKDQMPYQVGIVHVICFAISSLGVLAILKKNKKYYLSLYILSSVIILLSIFMIHPRSIAVWKLFDPVLKYIQFPWRFLILISFFVSLGTGGLFLFVKRFRYILFSVLVIVVTVLNYSYFRPEKFFNVTEKDYLSGALWEQQMKRSIFDYLPIYATLPPKDFASSNYEIISGNVEITNFNKGTNWINFNAKVDSPSEILISQYYFPGWKIIVNGNYLDIKHDNYLGLMKISLPIGENLVKARLVDSPVRSVGNIISLLMLLVIIGLLIYPKFRKSYE